MSNYITRIELHRAIESDYENLHAAMAKQGFSRKIESDQGDWYQLPTATYALTSSETRSQVFGRAKVAAESTKKAHSIIVTEGNSTFDLPKITNPLPIRR